MNEFKHARDEYESTPIPEELDSRIASGAAAAKPRGTPFSPAAVFTPGCAFSAAACAAGFATGCASCAAGQARRHFPQ